MRERENDMNEVNENRERERERESRKEREGIEKDEKKREMPMSGNGGIMEQSGTRGIEDSGEEEGEIVKKG